MQKFKLNSFNLLIMNKYGLLFFFTGMLSVASYSFGQNPLITNQFTADPTARVFEGKLYIYPSHDVHCAEGQGFIGFCMPDYHVFSSENLTDWKDHGIVLSQNSVPWVEPDSYRMWAPDCVLKNGKYYYYFPAWAREKINGQGKRIGVAIADNPGGPFIPEPNFMVGISGIDPNVFIGTDGKAYIYWADNRVIYGAMLSDNMLALKTVPVPITINGIGRNKFIEGPFVFERNGRYYLTFPYIPETTEQLVYSIGTSPLGPFEYKGVIMKESPVKCYTNHQSIVEFKGQTYLFYHHNDLSPKFDKNRSIKADSLFFNSDGTIQEIIPSLRGVGISNAESKIQIDRYSAKSEKGVAVEFVDTLTTFKGWKASLNQMDSWVRYNKVDFSNRLLKKVVINAKSIAGSDFEIRMNSVTGPLLAAVKLQKSNEWKLTSAKLKKYQAGIYDLYLVAGNSTSTEIDWISFE